MLGTPAEIYRELLVSLMARGDVVAVRFELGEIDMRPEPQIYESGRPAPEVLTLSIPRDIFEREYEGLREAAVDIGLDIPSDLPELAAFSLFDIHVEETINSLKEPGPHGFTYTGDGFVPY
ncbi:MAG: hypothetical protein ACTHZX_01170 [Microbacterium sp.]